MNKLLSIIIPMYNMENYISHTLDSLVCNYMDILDIIIVNDGSTDNSLMIASEWSDRFPSSVTIIDKANGGHGSAWNIGTSKACGKYLAYLDSDDWIIGLSSYIDRLTTAEADLIFNDCVIYNERDGKSKIKKIKHITPGIHNLDTEMFPTRSLESCRILNFHTCIYRTSLLKTLMPLFHEKTSYDDLILSVAPLVISNTYEYSSMPFYCYRLGRNDQSMAPNVISRKIDQQETERRYTIEFAMNNCPACSADKSQAIHRIVRAIATTYYNFIMKLDRPRRKDYLDRWSEYVTNTIPEPMKIMEYRAYVKYPHIYSPVIKLWHLYRRLFSL